MSSSDAATNVYSIKSLCGFKPQWLPFSRAELDRWTTCYFTVNLRLLLTRPSTQPFNDMTLLTFAKAYSTPKQPSQEPSRRRKEVIVVVRPYYSPDQNGPDYENYCRQKLMLHVSFRQLSQILGEHHTYADAYASCLRSSVVPPSLHDDVHMLEQQQFDDDLEDNDEVM